MKTNDCKELTVQKLKEVLKEKKKLNKSIKLSVNKEELCTQYHKYKTPTSPEKSPKDHMTELFEQTKNVAQSLKTMDDFAKLRKELTMIVDQEMIEFKKNKQYTTPEQVLSMLRRKEDMRKIIKNLMMIDDDFEREEVGTQALENDDFMKLFKKYTRKEQAHFLESIGRSTTEDWFISNWIEEDEKIVVNMLLKKQSMAKVITFLKKKKKDDYWTLSTIVDINHSDLAKLYTDKEIKQLERHIEISEI